MENESRFEALRRMAGARRECCHAGGFTLSVFVDIRQLCRLCRFDDTALVAGVLDVLSKPLKTNILFLLWRRHLDRHEFCSLPLRGRELLARESEEMAGEIEGREITDLLRMNTLAAGGHASAAGPSVWFEHAARDCSTRVDHMICWRIQRGGLQMCIRSASYVLFVMAFFASPITANGQETSLVGIYQGSELTAAANHLEQGGYELSGGTKVSFDKWYHSKWIDMRFEMLTQLSDDFGLLWGASTGQHAEKVRIEPGLKLGLILQKRPTPSTTLSLTVSSILGGNLTERPCTADYGAVGGFQTVNCRLAASQLRPADTLKYLANINPSRLKLDLRFRGEF